MMNSLLVQVTRRTHVGASVFSLVNTFAKESRVERHVNSDNTLFHTIINNYSESQASFGEGVIALFSLSRSAAVLFVCY